MKLSRLHGAKGSCDGYGCGKECVPARLLRSETSNLTNRRIALPDTHPSFRAKIENTKRFTGICARPNRLQEAIGWAKVVGSKIFRRGM